MFERSGRRIRIAMQPATPPATTPAKGGLAELIATSLPTPGGAGGLEGSPPVPRTPSGNRSPCYFFSPGLAGSSGVQLIPVPESLAPVIEDVDSGVGGGPPGGGGGVDGR